MGKVNRLGRLPQAFDAHSGTQADVVPEEMHLAVRNAVCRGLGNIVQQPGPSQHNIRRRAVQHLQRVRVDLFVVVCPALHLVHLQ